MRLLELAMEIWNKIDAYCQRQTCSPGTLLSEGVRSMRIFVGAPRRGASNDCVVVRTSDICKLKPILGYYPATWSALSAFQWPWNAWPQMILRCHFMLKSVFIDGLIRSFCFAFEDNYVKTNEDAPILLTTKIFARDSSFRRYKVYADIRHSSLGWSKVANFQCP